MVTGYRNDEKRIEIGIKGRDLSGTHMLAGDIFSNLMQITSELIDKNSDYCFDFIKLNKLLYLTECYILNKYKNMISIVNFPIVAMDDGPYIPDYFNFVFNYFGPDTIDKQKIEQSLLNQISEVCCSSIIELPYLRRECLKKIVTVFGVLDTRQIVSLAKNTYAYKATRVGSKIPNELLYYTGEQIKIILDTLENSQDSYITNKNEVFTLIMQSLKETSEQLRINQNVKSLTKMYD